MSRTFSMMLMVLMGLVLLAGAALAVPNRLQYQGRLTDAAGVPINGSQQVTFAIYGVPSGGTSLWDETINVTVANGLFNVLLGGATAFPGTLFDGDDLWLGIKVGADPEMTPRQQIASVAYSMSSGDASGTAYRWRSSTGGQAVGSRIVVDSVTIVAPTAGYVAVQGGGSCFIFHQNGTTSYNMARVSDVPAENLSALQAGVQQMYINQANVTTLYFEDFVSTRVFQVGPGPRTFYLNFEAQSGGGSNDGVEVGWIMATFHPKLVGALETTPQLITTSPEEIPGEDGVTPAVEQVP